MIYPARTIASWFVQKEPMTIQKVHLLCYYAQAWSYALKDVPLMDDDFTAGIHGPFLPALLEILKGPYWNTISQMPGMETNVSDLSAQDLCLLEDVWLTYGDQSSNALQALACSEPAWILARGGLDPYARTNRKISPECMKAYYRSIYIEEEEA